MSTGFAAFDALIKDRPIPDLVACDTCDRMTSCPVGVPEGWDAAYTNGAGWSFTCPGCLEGIEEEWRGGGYPSGSRAALPEREVSRAGEPRPERGHAGGGRDAAD